MSEKKQASFDLMKKQNLTTVFRTVVTKRAISRADITAITGLNRMTVTNCVRTLLGLDLMVEKEAVASPVGRPPVLLELNPAYGVLIGIEVNIISCKISVMEYNGRILEQQIVSEVAQDPDRFVEYIVDLTKGHQKKGHYLHGLLGLGIALPGNYNSATGCVEYISNMPRWNGYPIQQRLLEKLPGTLVRIQNAARAEADGELDFGSAREGEDVTYIYGAMGLSLSMYSQGGMHVGHRGFNGRFGHNVILAEGRLCTCGNRGCLEMYASVHSICQQLYPNQKVTDERIQEILQRKAEGDPEVLAAIKECIHYLAIGLANVINNFNPHRVCIGNYLGMILAGWEDRLNAEVNHYLLPHYRDSQRIYTSRLEEWGAALGSAAAVRTKVFEYAISE